MVARSPCGRKRNGRVASPLWARTRLAASCFAWRSANCAVGGESCPFQALGTAAQSPNAHTLATPVTRMSGSVFNLPCSIGNPIFLIRGTGTVPIAHRVRPVWNTLLRPQLDISRSNLFHFHIQLDL